jgi:CO/xanthine dehydrogenase Mo-binding subunit
MVAHASVGQRIKRVDGSRKVAGQERFTADLKVPGMLYARPVGSQYAHARIRGIDASRALAIPGVVAVLAADDLPVKRGPNGAPPKLPVAWGEALHVGQIVALVLAESDAAAQDGAAVVEIDFEPLPVVPSPDAAMAHEAPRVRTTALALSDDAAAHNADATRTGAANDESPPNVVDSVHLHQGDVARGLAEADEIVELTFGSRSVHQGYLEPQVCLATVEPTGDLTIYLSTQASFYSRTRVAEALGWPVGRINVVPMPVGGGFGGKYVLIEPLVAAAAVAVGRPVFMHYTRLDEFLIGNPAPGCRIELSLGAKRDGTLTALRARLTFDAGAAGGSPLHGAAFALGCNYLIPHLDVRGVEVLTHKPGPGAFRAPGGQQAAFAIESAIDELARRLEIDPIALRLTNCVVEGDRLPNGTTWPRIGLKECLETLRDHPAWQERATRTAPGRGVGVAIGGWGGGLEPATAVCRLDTDGALTVVLGTVDLSGTDTAFAQIAAETFGMDPAAIAIVSAPTDSAPYAGVSGGSKTTYTVGLAVQRAAEQAKRQILEIAADHLEAAVADLELATGTIRVKGSPGASLTLAQIAAMSMDFGQKYEPVYGRGASALTDRSPAFAAHLAEVEVDEETGETRVTRYVAVQDVGFAVNPALVEGQIQGGVAQGIGWALYEGMVYDADGQLLTATLTDYALPRAAMIPPIETVLLEIPSPDGPFGAKGVGEPPAIPGPAAVANAIRDAAGVRMTELPIRPEAVARRLTLSE